MSLDPRPDPNCGICHGSGELFDWEDYGSTQVRRYYDCECMQPPPSECVVYVDSGLTIRREPGESDEDVFAKATAELLKRLQENTIELAWIIDDETEAE